VTWDKIPGTTNSTEIGCSDVTTDNYVWMATTSGLKKWKMGDAAVTSVSVGSGVCNTIQVSKDGQLLVAAIGSANVDLITLQNALDEEVKSVQDALISQEEFEKCAKIRDLQILIEKIDKNETEDIKDCKQSKA
jgi:hypothetical protein